MKNKQKMNERFQYLLFTFITGCTCGWLYEEVFYLITEESLRNR